MQHPPQQSLMQQALEIIRRSVSGMPYRSQTELARASGESEANISRWLSGAATPTLRRLEPVLMCLGVGLTLRKDALMGITQADLPEADNLLQQLDSWNSVAEDAGERRFLRLRMPRNDISMQPVLCPGDIVLVDTADKSLQDRKIYLVDLMGGGFAFRRGFCDRNEPGRFILCADNAEAGCRPLSQCMDHAPCILGAVRHSIRAFV